MRLRRCDTLLIDPRESLEFDLSDLLSGGPGLFAQRQWFALAPHLGEEVALENAEVLALGAIGAVHWRERDELEREHGAGVVLALLDKGLLVSDDDAHADVRARDERQRNTFWHPLSAVAHAFSRWKDVDASDALTRTGLRTVGDMVEKFGAAPPHFHSRGPDRQALPVPAPTALAELMDRRTTCRHWDQARSLPLDLFGAVLHRVFAAHGELEAAPGASVVKKTSPSGGGLHATGTYLLVRHVDGVAPGLYHYHAGAHALEPLPCDDDDLHALAQRFVAGQHWFADAHVQVILAPRFRRSFWKYRNHAKGYRALILDAGHLSQTLYLTATELGLGAFITSAINEHEIERALGLDPLDEGPLAVCGFGFRGAERVTVEFDPLARVWPQPGSVSS